MVKGLVLYDYDGTLVDERDAIYVPSNITKKTISRLQDMGYLCISHRKSIELYPKRCEGFASGWLCHM